MKRHIMTRRVALRMALACLVVIPFIRTAFPQVGIASYVDPYDLQFVRIRSVANSQYLYEAAGNGTLQLSLIHISEPTRPY